MIFWAESLSRWLFDFYGLATLLLLGMVLLLVWDRRPARALSVCWAGTIGLWCLAFITVFQGFGLWVIPVFQEVRTNVAISDRAGVLDAQATADQTTTESARNSQVVSETSSSPSRVVAGHDGVGSNSDSAAASPASDAEVSTAQVWMRGTIEPLAPGGSQISWRMIIASVYLVSMIIVFLWQMLGAFLTLRLQRCSRPARDAVQSLMPEIWPKRSQPPVVLVTGLINQALASGLLNPVVLLPGWFERQESKASIRAVLRHEAAHIAHGDLWLRAFQRWLTLLLFAHPLYWFFKAATQANQEYLADAEASGETPLDYAEILLHWFRTGAASRNKALTATVGLWERPHLLKRRISMVLNENFAVERSCPWSWRLGSWSLILSGVLFLSCITLHAPAPAVAQDTGKKKPKKMAKKEAPPEKKPEATPEPDPQDDQLKFSDEQIRKAKEKYSTAEEAFNVGAAHYNSRNYAASREPFEAAAILDTEIEYRVKVYGALMASYRQLGTVEPFIAASEYIIRHSERDAEKSLTRRALLSFVHERGKVDPFIKRHEERLTKNPKEFLSLYLLSEVYDRMRENPARSVELLKRLAELEGKKSDDVVDVQANAKLATQYVRAKEYQKGAELFEKIAPQDPKMAAWHWKEAANAWLKLKKNEQALAAAKKSSESEPEKRSELLTHFWHRQLGDLFLALGEPKLAIPQFERAIENTKIEGYVKDCTASLAEAKKKAMAM